MNVPENYSGRMEGEVFRGHVVVLEVAVQALRGQLADVQRLATVAGQHNLVSDLKVVDAALAEVKKALVAAGNHIKK
jgi:3-keto-L-gulonate-6-phosphate decarboxylase